MLAFLLLASVATVVAAPALMSGFGAEATEDPDAVPELDDAEKGEGDLLDSIVAEDLPEAAGADAAPGMSSGMDPHTPDLATQDMLKRVMDSPVDPIAPEAGDTPDTPPADGLAGPGLAPTDPDAPDALPDDHVDAPVLSPTPGDAAEDLGDTAGQTSADAGPEPENAPLRVDSFAVGQDILRLTIDPGLSDEPLVVDVRPSLDGEDGVVTVNGRTVAILEDAPEAGPEDIEIEFERAS